MNYIGSKLSLLDFLDSCITDIAGKKNEIFCDLFAGTGVVGKHFKQKGMSVIANDIQYYSYVLNRHYIGNCTKTLFKGTDNIFDHLNNLPLQPGFIYNNYSLGGAGERMYFSDYNALKCDTIRKDIEYLYKYNKINDDEYFFLLASLIEGIDKYANTASVYGAYLKKLKKSAQKNFFISPLDIIYSDKPQYVFNEDASRLIKNIVTDILYLDPPYNARQYASNYHLLETIAKYDNPKIKGKTGLREYEQQKSAFCKKNSVKKVFADIILNAKSKYIFLSYNNEGLMSLNDIKEIMSTRGRYGYFTIQYNRFKADSSRQYKESTTVEYLHWLKCD